MQNFEISVTPDAVSLTKSRALTGKITAQVAGQPFPDEAWSDFLVILAHWTLAAARMNSPDVNSVTLGFMDGPYEIVASRAEGKRWTLSAKNRAKNLEEARAEFVSVEEITGQIHDAARKVVSFCEAQGINSPDLAEIKSALCAKT